MLARSVPERHRDGDALLGAVDVELAARLDGLEVGDPQPDALAVLERGLGAGLEDVPLQVGDSGTVVDDVDSGPAVAVPNPDLDLGLVRVIVVDGVLREVPDRLREPSPAGQPNDGGLRGVDSSLDGEVVVRHRRDDAFGLCHQFDRLPVGVPVDGFVDEVPGLLAHAVQSVGGLLDPGGVIDHRRVVDQRGDPFGVPPITLKVAVGAEPIGTDSPNAMAETTTLRSRTMPADSIVPTTGETPRTSTPRSPERCADIVVKLPLLDGRPVPSGV
jgi:hypothetical protein